MGEIEGRRLSMRLSKFEGQRCNNALALLKGLLSYLFRIDPR